MTANHWRALVERRIKRGARWNASADPLVKQAASVLEAFGFRAPDVTRVTVCRLPDGEGSASQRRQRIRLAADGDAYAAALHGDPLFLAAVLLHEGAHLDGAGEETAYALERAFLRLADARPALVAWVDGIADAALRNVWPYRGVSIQSDFTSELEPRPYGWPSYEC